ncbi:MAG: alanine racemase [Rhodospirillales bacterium]|nr:alanine racemase [Rhodospirillales bacterium]MSP79565.1 alanine racemase [Rhodospirillales bacterium]
MTTHDVVCSARTSPRTASAIVTVDLDALAANWRLLKARLAPGADCAAVVKADAYGLGAKQIAPALRRAGCRTFFVVTLDEGLDLAPVVPGCSIYVLAPPLAGNEAAIAAAGLIPTLNSLGDVAAWSAFARAAGRPLPAALHADTGMRRLGFAPAEMAVLTREPERLAGLDVRLFLSHLACADEPRHPLNAEQLTAFVAAKARLAAAGVAPRASLANSSGIFLGPEYHFDLVRPGAALYGIAPVPGQHQPMAPVVRVQAKILQVRDVDAPATVGYGATHRFSRPSRIATVAAGYADGYPRSLSSVGICFVGEHRAAVVGRVSMDLTTIDVTGIPENLVRPGMFIDLIGPLNPLDEVAAAAGTIGYELLTRLGRRAHRVWQGGGTP